jgi:hypothetical protein
MKYPSPKQRGIALVTVLIAAVVAIVLLNILNVSLMGEIRGSRSGKVRGEMLQAADGVSEQARLELVRLYKTQNLTPQNFIASLTKAPRTAVRLENGLSGAWDIGEVSDFSDGFGWVDVRATVKRGHESQTVVRRVAFGKHDMFNLALLAEDTSCMYCHLRVNGDVGNLGVLRPGWGSEGDSESECSGNDDGGSTVYGSVYSSVAVSADCRGSGNEINGALITKEINEFTTTNLPTDALTKEARFPAVKRTVALANANGSLSGGVIIKVPKGGSLSAAQLAAGGSSAVSKTSAGNVVLIGTPSNPILLDKDVYIDGDVIIKGVVRGRGAIYAGRNLYVAGDITYQNPPDPIGFDLCAGLLKNVEADERSCAKKNIQAGRDELRLAARGTIVLGDYTERDGAGNLASVNKLQSANYYRDQFGFDDDQNHYYDATTGDELICQGSNTSKCVNVEEQAIPAGNVIERTPNRSSDIEAGDISTDAYSYSFRPGSIDASRSFKEWVSDGLYRDQILGTKEYSYNTWRVDLAGLTTTQRKDLLLKAGLSQTTVDEVIKAIKIKGEGDIVDDAGNVIGYFNNPDHDNGQIPVKFVFDVPRSYENQVTNISAFLYSNYRIAGKTSMLAMNISGGMITREMGVLAPGRFYNDWMTPSRYDFLKNPDAAASDCGQPGDAYYVPGTLHCALTVNYDYRLKAGGFGFNLIDGKPGQTIAWRLSDSKTERALP